MKGDFSRSTFDPKKHYTSVRMQQGRMQLDADWNEQMDILLHLLRGQARDLLGPYGAPESSAGGSGCRQNGRLCQSGSMARASNHSGSYGFFKT